MNDYAHARKQYVEDVKRSFHEHGDDMDYEEDDIEGQFPFWKLRLLIAALLFAVFLVYDYTGAKLYIYTSEQIVELVEEHRFEPQIDMVRETLAQLGK